MSVWIPGFRARQVDWINRLLTLPAPTRCRSPLEQLTNGLWRQLSAAIPLLPHATLATFLALVSPPPCCRYASSIRHLGVTPGDIVLLPSLSQMRCIESVQRTNGLRRLTSELGFSQPDDP